MQHNKNTEFVMYVDNFLEKETLKSLQDNILNTNHKEIWDSEGNLYGKRFTFPESFKKDPLLGLIKQYFFPHRNLVPISLHSHLRLNTEKPLFHIDDQKGGCANFLLFVKGEPLLNNGTGFLSNEELSSHVGFVENRALFFNGSKVKHGDLQSFGDSSPRYTLNIFYREEE
jgi:hypothetical protein|tara:strand:+ start:1050 stop:1562 length:513 start_codon:yes stop_codon:yes gene_type:complete